MKTQTNGAIKIERGIPVPLNSVKRSSKYPLREMEVGDSFSIPKDQRLQLSSYMTSAGRDMNAKFISRQDGNIVRVWRVA